MPGCYWLGGQCFAAFGTTSRQDGAARPARHPLHKTVLFCTLTFFWLVGSFWHMFSLYRIAGRRAMLYPWRHLAVFKTMFNPLILAGFPHLSKFSPQFYRCGGRVCIKLRKSASVLFM